MSSGDSSVLIKNALANYGGFFFQIGIAFLLSPFLVHTLGDTKYGIWSIVSSLSGYLCLLDLGISSAVTRYVSRYKQSGETDEMEVIINSGFGLYALVGIFLVLISPIIANVSVSFINVNDVLSESIRIIIILTTFDVSFFLMAGAYRGVFQGLQQYGTINFILIVTGIVKSFMFYLLLSNGYGLISMSVIAVLEKIITLIFFYFILKKYINFRFKTSKVTRNGIKTIIQFSFFTFINMIANQIIYYTDAFVVGYFINAAAVTYYSISWSLVEYVKKFCMSFTRVFIPAFSAMEADDDFNKIRQYLITGSKYSLLICCLFCIGLILYGREFINLWMGVEYGVISYPVLVILVISQFIELPQQICLAVLLGLSKHKYMSYVSLTTGIVNVIFSIALVGRYGIIGVAVGTIVPQIFIYGIFMFIYTNKCVSLSLIDYFVRSYVPVIIPSMIMVFSGVGMKNIFVIDSYISLCVNASICGIIFIVSSYFISLSKIEKNVFTSKLMWLKDKSFRVIK